MEGQIDPTADPGAAPQLDENGNPIPEVPSVIDEEVLKDMQNIWSVFDTDNSNQVTIDELRTIMRALDVTCNDEATEAILR